MKKHICLFSFAVCVFCAIGADIIPSELVGVWAPAKSKLKGDLVYEGYAMYIKTNGETSIVAAPPPIGAIWHATYNATNRVLTLFIEAQPDNGLMQGLTNRLIYDPKAKTLIYTDDSTKDVLTRHGNRVPEDAFE